MGPNLLRAWLSSIAAFASALAAQAAFAQLVDTRAVPTYESVGLYWSNPGPGAANGCQVRFRVVGTLAWKQGLDLWYDARNSECRGSLVHLTPNTAYEAELTAPGALLPRIVLFSTWANQVPVASTVTVPSGSGQLTISQGGSPLGYVVYQGAPGAVRDAADAQQYNILVNASYVVIRGLTLRGAQQHAIRLSANVTDVIIEDNDIANWGRPRGGGLGENADSAIYAFCTTGATLTRVTIQRNVIHDPRYASNSWSTGHPTGPQAITIERCPGNHVIRHNDITSPSGRYYNDIIGGSDNTSTAGFPNHDSDIYGNKLMHAWDDAIEAEGGNRNVRVWNNYMDRTGTGVASTVTSIGPLYMFRNVYNRGRMLAAVPLDQDDRQTMFKAGSDASVGNGRRYVFHNTMLQATGEGAVYGLGGSSGTSGTGPTRLIHATVTRNNIWHLWRPWEAIYDEGPDNDFGWDMYNGNPGAPIVNGIRATPTYAPGHGWQSESGGQYQLAPGTPGYDQGTPIPNFNDGFNGSAPDRGAHEGGSPPMRFGVSASSGPAVPGGSPQPQDPPRLANLSTRGMVLIGDNVMIGSFIIGGPGTKTVVMRARGPSLAEFGVPGTLQNPVMQLYSGQVAIATNDDWEQAPNKATIQASGFAPKYPRESAIYTTLSPGPYTAIVSGFGGTTGVGIFEVFEVDAVTTPLVNIATRGQVLTGDNVMIGGFIIQGSGPQTVLVRARGPSLATFGVPGTLSDPTLELYSGQTLIASNDDWRTAANSGSVQAGGNAPPDDRESAILVTLAPGAYTAIVRGKSGQTGVGIVEVFAADE